MYEELLTDIRYCVSGDKPCGECKHITEFCCDTKLMEKAADAIEELSQYVNNIKRLKHEGWYLQQSKYHDGYQAIATMPLPEPPKEEKV